MITNARLKKKKKVSLLKNIFASQNIWHFLKEPRFSSL